MLPHICLPKLFCASTPSIWTSKDRRQLIDQRESPILLSKLSSSAIASLNFLCRDSSSIVLLLACHSLINSRCVNNMLPAQVASFQRSVSGRSRSLCMSGNFAGAAAGDNIFLALSIFSSSGIHVRMVLGAPRIFRMLSVKETSDERSISVLNLIHSRSIC